MKHVFKALYCYETIQTNSPLIGSDICIICGKNATEIGLPDVNKWSTTSYELNNYDNILKCLTEEEYAIKKILE